VQLLPLPRNSTPITNKELRELEEKAERTIEKIELLNSMNPQTRIYIAYSGSWYAPASSYITYWPIKQLIQTAHIEVAPIESFLYQLFAYTRGEEDTLLVYYSEPGTENFIGRTLATTRALNIKSLIVSPPVPEPITLYRDERLHELITLTSEKLPLLFIVFSAKLVTRILDGFNTGIKLRQDRVKEEFSKVSTIYESLLERYDNEISLIKDSLKRASNVGVYYSATMQSAALYWSYIIEQRYKTYAYTYPVSTFMSRLGRVKQHDLSIVLTTDAEQDIVKEVMFKSKFAVGTNEPLILTIHTDPLTASLYGCLIAESLQ
jgi:hypothetical protein